MSVMNSGRGMAEAALKRTSNYTDTKQISGKQLYDYPRFKKLGQIFNRGMAPWVTQMYGTNAQIYFPSILYAGDIAKRKYPEKFYLYYSTDHATGEGGIGLATSNSIKGPYIDRGRIFVDTLAGEQTETPSVVYNEQTGKVHLYYHNNYWASGDTGVYATQATCLALSDNAVDFTIHTAPLIRADVNSPGDGHTGYARVQRYGELWLMRHSMGGTNYSHKGISYSYDGINWVVDHRPILGNAEYASDGVTRQISVNETFRWRGELWANVNDSAWVSGTNTAPSKIYVSKFKNPRFPGKGKFEALTLGGSGAFDEKSITNITFLEYDDNLYMIYQGVSSGSVNSFGLAVAEV